MINGGFKMPNIKVLILPIIKGISQTIKQKKIIEDCFEQWEPAYCKYAFSKKMQHLDILILMCVYVSYPLP